MSSIRHLLGVLLVLMDGSNLSRWHTCASANAAASPEKRGPSAAFCMSGCPRGMRIPAVHRSAQRNFIEAFGAPESRVFWLLKMTADCEITDKEEPLSSSELDGARAALRPARERLIGHRGAEILADGSFGPPLHRCTGSNEAEQTLHISKCFEMVEEDERERGIRYDWVFRVRPELIWYRRFPHYSYFAKKKNLVFLLEDWVIMAPRVLADRLFKPVQPCHRGARGAGNHERVLAANLERAKAHVRYQCDYAACSLNMSMYEPNWKETMFAPSWKEWRCNQPIAIVKHNRQRVMAPCNGERFTQCEQIILYDKPPIPYFNGGRVFAAYPCAGTPVEECKHILNLTDAEVDEHVERWHSRPMCGKACMGPEVNSLEKLMQCEKAQAGEGARGAAKNHRDL